MEIQNMLLPANSNVLQPSVPIPSGGNKPNKKCYMWNNKKWVGKKPQKPLYTECGLKKCIECDK